MVLVTRQTAAELFLPFWARLSGLMVGSILAVAEVASYNVHYKLTVGELQGAGRRKRTLDSAV